MDRSFCLHWSSFLVPSACGRTALKSQPCRSTSGLSPGHRHANILHNDIFVQHSELDSSLVLRRAPLAAMDVIKSLLPPAQGVLPYYMLVVSASRKRPHGLLKRAPD